MTCSSCPYLCASCISFSNCTSCINNYTLSSTKQCNSNITNCSVANCLSCSNDGTCLQCLNNYYLINLANTSYCTASCPAGTFAQNSQCILCPSYCSNCSAYSCINCNSGYYMYNSNCYLKCPSGTIPSQGMCQPDPCIYYNTTNSNICLRCAAPYFLAATTVNNTNSSVIGCVLNCPSGTISVKSVCLPCPANCKNCAYSTICIQCQSGYYLYQGICQSLCPLGFYAYNSQCTACTITFCTSCVYNSG